MPTKIRDVPTQALIPQRIAEFLDKQPTDSVFTRAEIMLAVKCGNSALKDSVAKMPTYSVSVTHGQGGSQRWWGHPTAIKHLKAKKGNS